MFAEGVVKQIVLLHNGVVQSLLCGEQMTLQPGRQRSSDHGRAALIGPPGLIILISIMFVMGLTTCDRPGKTIRLQWKLKPGLITVYDFLHRGQGLATEGDSVLYQFTHERFTKQTETIDSLSGDSAAWVSAISITTSQHETRRETTVVDSTNNENKYQYLLRPNGEILSSTPLVGLDPDWAEHQLEYLKQLQPIFPEIDMTVGFTWTKNVKVLLFDETREANGVYTLKSFVRDRGYDCAVIEYEGHYLLPMVKETEKVKVTGVSTITTKGTIYFAYREGVLVQDRTWWVLNSDRKVEYLVDSEDGHKAGTVQQVTIVSEGDTKYILVSATFGEPAR